MIGIYKIENKLDGKKYYGSSKNIKKRWNRHKRDLNRKIHDNVYLQRAWNKYGEENFIFDIVYQCDEESLLIIEQKYLDTNPEYNIGINASGGDNLTNNPNKEDIINRMKKTIRNKIDNMSEEERREKWSKPKDLNPNWRGGSSTHYCECGKEIGYNHITCSDCRDRTGENNPFYGKKHTKETKEKIGKKRKGKYLGDQNIPIIIDGIEYRSAGEATEKLKIPMTTIRWRVRSKNKKFVNYRYK